MTTTDLDDLHLATSARDELRRLLRLALPTVILAFFYGQSRIFFTVARDLFDIGPDLGRRRVLARPVVVGLERELVLTR